MLKHSSSNPGIIEKATDFLEVNSSPYASTEVIHDISNSSIAYSKIDQLNDDQYLSVGTPNGGSRQRISARLGSALMDKLRRFRAK
jgi:hypothetical protein